MTTSLEWFLGGSLDFWSGVGGGYGRTTSTSCSSSNGVLPEPEKSCSDVQRVFVTNMVMTLSEAAALMGVHSLGKAYNVYVRMFKLYCSCCRPCIYV